MKNVLMISFHFWPSSAVGAKRVVRFAKHLLGLGWNPVILTTAENNIIRIDRTTENAMNCYVHRTEFKQTLNPNAKNWFARKMFNQKAKWLGRFMIPDQYHTWIKPVVDAGLMLCQKKNIDVVYVSAPPWSSIMAGVALKKKTNLPLVLDYRDPWWNRVDSIGTEYTKRKNRSLEKSAVNEADALIFNTKETSLFYLNSPLPIQSKKTYVISNSVDPDISIDNSERYSKFTILHLGSLYGGRSMSSIYKALSNVFSKNPETRGEIQLISCGSASKSEIKKAASYNLEDMVKFRSWIPWAEAKTAMQKSHLFIAVVGNGHEGQVPAKIFDYLAFNKPIICIAPARDIEAEKILAETGAGIVIPVDEADVIEQNILNYFNLYLENKPLIDNDNLSFENYLIHTNCQKLKNIFEHVI